MPETPPDALQKLIAQRGDEMSHVLRTNVAAIAVLLRVIDVVVPAASVAAGLLLSLYLAVNRHPLGVGAYFVVAMPMSLASFVGVRAFRALAASRIARALHKHLDAVGGAMTSTAVSLLPRGDDPRA